MKTAGSPPPSVAHLQQQLRETGGSDRSQSRAASLGKSLSDGVASWRDYELSKQLVFSAVRHSQELGTGPRSALVESAQAVMGDVRAMIDKQGFMTTLREMFKVDG